MPTDELKLRKEPRTDSDCCAYVIYFGGKEIARMEDDISQLSTFEALVKQHADLVAENERMREALRKIAKLAGQSCNDFTDLDVSLDARQVHQMACAALPPRGSGSTTGNEKKGC